jgi:hypothetical protein
MAPVAGNGRGFASVLGTEKETDIYTSIFPFEEVLGLRKRGLYPKE